MSDGQSKAIIGPHCAIALFIPPLIAKTLPRSHKTFWVTASSLRQWQLPLAASMKTMAAAAVARAGRQGQMEVSTKTGFPVRIVLRHFFLITLQERQRGSHFWSRQQKQSGERNKVRKRKEGRGRNEDCSCLSSQLLTPLLSLPLYASSFHRQDGGGSSGCGDTFLVLPPSIHWRRQRQAVW